MPPIRSLPLLISLFTLQALLQCCGSEPGNQVRTAYTPLIQDRGEGLDKWHDQLPRPAWSKFRRVESSQAWFEVYEVLPSIFAIYEPGQFEEVISYLIVGSEAELLSEVDSLLPAHNEPLLPSIYLERMRDAFAEIAAETTP